MPSQKSTELARQILDDLRGATYYADPKILGGLLKGYVGTEAESENAAIELLRQLLYKHASQCAVTRVEYDEPYIAAGHQGKPEEVAKKGGTDGPGGLRASGDGERLKPRSRRSSGW